jgi:hypothetical protein
MKMGSAEQFATLRTFLRSRYSADIVAAALGIKSMAEFEQREDGRPVRDPLVRLFFAGAAIPASDFHSAVPTAAADAMLALGLVAREGRSVWCPVMLYPIGSLFFVSDRFTNPDGSPFEAGREFVYFALTPNTRNFMASLPHHPCEAFLDIGAGCGAAALVQAAFASSSAATDIAERSTLFASFNAALNGLTNVEALQGSLYEPVAGRMFDRIACHPPYDISASTPWTFADGGDDGEAVVRGVIQGLPDHLLPGGEFFSLFRASDRTGKPLEHRIREWLGDRHTEFDLGIVVRETTHLQDYVLTAIMSTTRELSRYEELMERMRSLGVEQLAYANLIIRRKTDTTPPLTLRRNMGERCTSAELEWLLDWETKSPAVDISGMVPVVSPAMELVVRHRSVRGELRPSEYSFHASLPFAEETQCPEWIVVLVSNCDGVRTANEVYTLMQKHGPVQPAQFFAAVKRLVSAGVLQLASGSKMTSSS